MADFNNQTIHLDGGLTRTLATGDTVTFNVAGFSVTNSLTVGGNLDVAGNIISRDEERVLVADNFLDVNFGYEGTLFQTGGINVVYKAVSSSTTVNSTTNNITFAAADGSTNRAQVSLATSSGLPADTFAAGDLVQIQGTTNAENDGIYIVHDQSAAGVLVVKSVNLTSPDSYNFKPAQVDFTAETESTSSSVKFTHVTCTTLQLDSNGAWVTSTGDDDAAFATAGDLGSSSLQEAYDTGNTITTASTTDIAFTLSSGDFVVNGGGAVDFGSAGANLSSFAVVSDGSVSLTGGANSTLSTTSGTLTLDGNGGVNIQGNAAEIDVTTSGALDLNSGAGTWDASSLVLTSGGVTTVSSTSGQLTLNASGQNFVADGAVLDLDATDSSHLTMTANDAADKTLTISAFNQGAGEGLLSLQGGDQVDISDGVGILTLDGGALSESGMTSVNLSPSGAVDLIAGAASSFTTSAGALSLTGAAGVTVTSTGGQLTLDGAGQTVDLNAATLDVDGGAMDFDGSEFHVGQAAALDVDINATDFEVDASNLISLDAGAASNFTTSAGALTLDGAGGVNIAGNAAEIDVTTSGALDLNSGAGTWDASTLSIDSTAATNFTMTANDANAVTMAILASNSGAGVANIDLHTDGKLDLEASTVEIGHDGTAGTTIRIGESTQANPIRIDAGTDRLQLFADSGISMEDAVIFGTNAGAVFKNDTGAQIDAGRVVFLSGYDNTVGGEITYANSGNNNHPIGVAIVSISDQAAGPVHTVPGTYIRGATIAAGANAGDALFLNGTSISATAPNSGTVYRLGYCVDQGAGDFIWQPQFIAKIA